MDHETPIADAASVPDASAEEACAEEEAGVPERARGCGPEGEPGDAAPQ